ncbi:putative DNA-binding transcriptional regulator YafY [Pedobacter sp. AK013]|uniref:helix-turn-helix domain-containing protein n=1 Tax=Pedobacter sp. AK013 TaxID=2723071 RepID=UPI00160D12D7|nr:putative DNA-binding transcriptional regulator YafY [Pedobacter sp. AK013]
MKDDFLYQLERIDSLIRMKSTGHPQVLAEKLHLSERSIYNYITILKKRGAPIKYCRTRKSYYYSCAGKFCFEFMEIK